MFASVEPKRTVKDISHQRSRWSDGKVLKPKNPQRVVVIPGEAKLASIVLEPRS